MREIDTLFDDKLMRDTNGKESNEILSIGP